MTSRETTRRPTRWTRRRRLTKPGHGGWRISRYGFSYTHPVTGDGVSAGWNLKRALGLRRDQEARRGTERRHKEP